MPGSEHDEHAGGMAGLDTGVVLASDPMVSIRPELPPRHTATVQLGEAEAGTVPESALGSLGLDSGGLDALDATQQSGSYAIPVVEHEGVESLDEHTGYELLEQIGIGGMGEVWEARQRSLGRSVALKRLRKDRDKGAGRGQGRSSSVIEQFESEARFAGALDHPNIVTIHEYGHDQAGRVFYTMKLVEGTPWDELIQTGRRRSTNGDEVELELRDHLDILVEVAQAIAFAHSRGVIHRDIKPANVMIGDYGEVLVVDWGLAVAVCELEALGGDKTWTIAKLPPSALICGTPAYMAPETASAVRERIGCSTDVYLLGAVLFHLLYGRPPHKGKSVKEVITKAKANAFAFPRVLPGRVKPWDALLRPVLNQALATQPSMRFADAGEFGDAVRRALRNYDSAKVASRAQEKLARLSSREADNAHGYEPLVALIGQLEGALESWPENLAARQALAQAQLELAALALDNGDLALAKLSIESYEKLPRLPALAPARTARRLTIHPADGTLVSAPRPTDSLVAAGTSNEWSGVSSGPRPKSAALAATLGAVELARARQLSAAHESVLAGDASSASIASVQIQQDSSASMVSGEQRLLARAVGLQTRLEQRERSAQTRRRALWVAGTLSIALTVAFVGAMVIAVLVGQGRREQATRVLLEETANTVEARIELQLRPVLGALVTSTRWAELGALELGDQGALNQYFMPLLGGLDAASSMLYADALGNEYMLLHHEDGSWETRVTVAGASSMRHSWDAEGRPGEQRSDSQLYDPLGRPWYIGGASLRGAARQAREQGRPMPVFWTAPYAFFTTQEVGISVSAPTTDGQGHDEVLAFDLLLGDLSRQTSGMPEGMEAGQVFVLDEQLRVLGLPRETAGLSSEARQALTLTDMAKLDAAPLSSGAFRAWQEQHGDAGGPVRFDHEDGETYWVGMRLLDDPALPALWIGVIVPESHFLDF